MHFTGGTIGDHQPWDEDDTTTGCGYLKYSDAERLAIWRSDADCESTRKSLCEIGGGK